MPEDIPELHLEFKFHKIRTTGVISSSIQMLTATDIISLENIVSYRIWDDTQNDNLHLKTNTNFV